MEDISMRGAVVRISQDSMEAYLTLQPPEAGKAGESPSLGFCRKTTTV